MDSSEDSSEPQSPAAEGSLFGKWKVAIILLALVLLGTILIVVSSSSRREKLVWLSDTALPRAMQPSPFTRLKFKLIRLTAPLWRWHRPRRPNIRINARLLELTPAGPAAPILLGSATSTNADGTRAWILSAEDFSALKSRIVGAGTVQSETSITV